MKVILLQDIRGTGKKHEVKEVKEGHARNFLIPHGFAKPATPENVRALQALSAAHDKETAEAHARAAELTQLFKERALIFPVKTNEHGAAFGSVTKEMILSALRDQEFVRKERIHILLEHPLKELGEHAIPLELKKGVVATLRVILQQQP